MANNIFSLAHFIGDCKGQFLATTAVMSCPAFYRKRLGLCAMSNNLVVPRMGAFCLKSLGFAQRRS